MEVQNPGAFKICTVLGLISFSIPTIILGLWILAFNMGNNQLERVELFLGYFPEFLHGKFTLTLLSIGSCLLSILFNSIGLSFKEDAWRKTSISLLVFSILLLLLNVFQLL